MMMSFCCRRDHNYDGLDEPNAENSPLMRNGNGSLVDGVIASRRSANDDLNFWTNPDDVNHSISDDDRQLSELLEMRRSATTREEEMYYHEKIEEIRKMRKKVQERWKRVLSELGFADEQAKLVAVSSVTRAASPNTSVRAYNLHDKLVKETSIFGEAPTQRHRYAVILDRLLDLDITDDFLEAANELYPKKAEGPPKRRKRKSRGKIRPTDTEGNPDVNGNSRGAVTAIPNGPDVGRLIVINGRDSSDDSEQQFPEKSEELTVSAEVHEVPR